MINSPEKNHNLQTNGISPPQKSAEKNVCEEKKQLTSVPDAPCMDFLEDDTWRIIPLSN